MSSSPSEDRGLLYPARPSPRPPREPRHRPPQRIAAFPTNRRSDAHQDADRGHRPPQRIAAFPTLGRRICLRLLRRVIVPLRGSRPSLRRRDGESVDPRWSSSPSEDRGLPYTGGIDATGQDRMVSSSPSEDRGLPYQALLGQLKETERMSSSPSEDRGLPYPRVFHHRKWPHYHLIVPLRGSRPSLPPD